MREQATAWGAQAMTLIRLGEVEAAREAFDSQIGFLRDIAAADNSGQVPLQAAVIRAGRALGLAGLGEAARGYLDEGVTLARDIAARQPDDTDARLQFASALSTLATVAGRDGDSATIRAALTEAAETLRGAGAAGRHDLVVVLARLGDTALAADDVTAAGDAYREAQDLAETALTEAGDDPAAVTVAQRDLILALNAQGQLEGTRGDLRVAYDAFAQAIAVARDLRALAGDTAYPDPSFAELLARQATYGIFVSEDEAAETAARAALDLLPDSPAATRALAHALMFKGDTDAARAIYDPLMANEEGRAAVLSDFAALAFLGRQATLMDELRDIAAE
jgi:tetratricopeptide (TPR) repeat protein